MITLKRKLLILITFLIPVFFIISPLSNMFSEIFIFENGRISTSSLKRFLSEEDFSLVILRSIAFAFFSSLISSVLGLTSALCLARFKMRWKSFYLSAGAIPFLLPSFLPCVVGVKLFGFSGFLSEKIKILLGVWGDSITIFSFSGAVITQSLILIPFTFYPVYFSLKISGKAMYNQLRLETSNIKSVLISAFHQAGSAMKLGFFIAFLRALVEFQIPDLLLIKVFSVKIYTQFSSFYDFGGAVVYSIPLLLILCLFIYLIFRVKKDEYYPSVTSEWEIQDELKIGRFEVFPQIICFSILILPILTEIGFIVWWAFSSGTFFKAILSAKSEILTTISLGIISGFTILFFSIIPSYTLKFNFKYKLLLIFILALPLTLPAPLFGIGMIKLWNRHFLFMDKVYHSPLILILCWVTLFLPFGIFLLRLGFREVGEDLEDAAKIDGASFIQRLKYIYLLPLKNYFISVFLIGTIFSFSEIGGTILVTPPGYTTLSVRIFTLLHYGLDDFVSALCLMQIILILPIIFLIYKFFSIREYSGKEVEAAVKNKISS